MAAFFVSLIEVNDASRNAANRKNLALFAENCGGIIRALGNKRLCFEGPEVPSQISLVEFKTLEQGQDFYKPSECADISREVDRAAEVTTFAVEGDPLNPMTGRPGYFIVRMNIHNLEGYKAYSAQAGPILKNWGGQFIAAGPLEQIEGHSAYERCVLIRFPDISVAKDFRESQEYGKAVLMREGMVEMQQFVIEIGRAHV